ncbi:hypothetical protein BDN70DRAFT_921096 [Pholiota conissans]|uniref:DUF1772-domain-containing protein n=1 Tax=Pholiota conissans TaxID=109636 RepID=A0A9P5Z406_9AGAR|nr:hypothetical protein BDN70DRAFT_921096 [Pholiota conissans]
MAMHPVGLLLSRNFASPYSVFLGFGLGTISYYFWGTLVGQSTGSIFIALNPDARKELRIDASKAVEIWKYSYVTGAKHFGISSALAPVAVLAAALTVPYGSDVTQKYLLRLSGLLLSITLYTFIIVLPTNNRIVAIYKKIKKNREESMEPSVSPLSTAEEEEVVTLFRKWKNLHYTRIVLGALGWVGTFAAYLASV